MEVSAFKLWAGVHPKHRDFHYGPSEYSRLLYSNISKNYNSARMRTIYAWRVLRGLPLVKWRKPCEEQYVRAQFADAPAICNVLRGVTPTRRAAPVTNVFWSEFLRPTPQSGPLAMGTWLYSLAGRGNGHIWQKQSWDNSTARLRIVRASSCEWSPLRVHWLAPQREEDTLCDRCLSTRLYSH